MKYILGSGILGLIAKEMYPEWEVIPFGRSRHFSFTTPLADNFIHVSDMVGGVIGKLSAVAGHIHSVKFIKRAFSVNGELVSQFDAGLCSAWATKIFGSGFPTHIPAYYSNRMASAIYDLSLTTLYAALLAKYEPYLKAQVAKGEMTAIKEGRLIWGGREVPFEKIVSTIPLQATMRYLDMPLNLKFKPCHFIHMESKTLNLEGANQVLVADQAISFFKVNRVAKDRYIFYCHEDIPNAGGYFMSMIDDFELLEGTRIDDAIPLSVSDCPILERMGIITVGSAASNDWCEDVGSSIAKLVTLGV